MSSKCPDFRGNSLTTVVKLFCFIKRLKWFRFHTQSFSCPFVRNKCCFPHSIHVGLFYFGIHQIKHILIWHFVYFIFPSNTKLQIQQVLPRDQKQFAMYVTCDQLIKEIKLTARSRELKQEGCNSIWNQLFKISMCSNQGYFQRGQKGMSPSPILLG